MAYVKHILNLRGKICLKNKTYFQPYSKNILIVCITCIQTLVYRTFRFVCSTSMYHTCFNMHIRTYYTYNAFYLCKLYFQKPLKSETI